MDSMIVLVIGIVLGIIIQRLFSAHVGEFWELGLSWDWGRSKLYRWLHRLYCEFCPRRLHCRRYKQETQK